LVAQRGRILPASPAQYSQIMSTNTEGRAQTCLTTTNRTPRGRLSRLEKEFVALPWEKVRESVQVKLLEQDGELYVLANSGARVHKEGAVKKVPGPTRCRGRNVKKVPCEKGAGTEMLRRPGQWGSGRG
jgi:hypothetical protein